MQGKIKDFTYGGVGVVVAYFLISIIITLITGTTSTDTMFKTFIPTIIAVGGGLLVLGIVFG